MTMPSFRGEDSESDAAAVWAAMPPADGERALAQIADWGPTEDWADWADAVR